MIDNEQKADLALKEMKELTDEIKTNQETTSKEIGRLEEQLKETNAPLLQRIEEISESLEKYHRENRPDDIVIKLQHGTISLKKRQPIFKRDKEKIIQWLNKKGDKWSEYIKVKKDIDWQKLKDYLVVVGDKMVVPETVEVVEGIKVVPRDRKFYINL